MFLSAVHKIIIYFLLGTSLFAQTWQFEEPDDQNFGSEQDQIILQKILGDLRQERHVFGFGLKLMRSLAVMGDFVLEDLALKELLHGWENISGRALPSSFYVVIQGVEFRRKNKSLYLKIRMNKGHNRLSFPCRDLLGRLDSAILKKAVCEIRNGAEFLVPAQDSTKLRPKLINFITKASKRQALLKSLGISLTTDLEWHKLRQSFSPLWSNMRLTNTMAQEIGVVGVGLIIDELSYWKPKIDIQTLFYFENGPGPVLKGGHLFYEGSWGFIPNLYGEIPLP